MDGGSDKARGEAGRQHALRRAVQAGRRRLRGAVLDATSRGAGVTVRNRCACPFRAASPRPRQHILRAIAKGL